MKLLHESIQVSLSIPRHVDETFKNLGYDVNQLYQRNLLDVLRSQFDAIGDDVPVVRGARLMLEQEVKHLDKKS